MFAGANIDANLSSEDTSSIEDMSEMFRGATSFDGNISTWSVVNVRDMSSMFQGCVTVTEFSMIWSYSSVFRTTVFTYIHHI